MKKIGIVCFFFVAFSACTKHDSNKKDLTNAENFLFAKDGAWRICSFTIDGIEQLNTKKYSDLDANNLKINFVYTDKNNDRNKLLGNKITSNCYSNFYKDQDTKNFRFWNSNTDLNTPQTANPNCLTSPFDQDLVPHDVCGYWTVWVLQKVNENEAIFNYNFRSNFIIKLCR